MLGLSNNYIVYRHSKSLKTLVKHRSSTILISQSVNTGFKDLFGSYSRVFGEADLPKFSVSPVVEAHANIYWVWMYYFKLIMITTLTFKVCVNANMCIDCVLEQL